MYIGHGENLLLGKKLLLTGNKMKKENDMKRIKFYVDATKVGMPFVCANEGGFQDAVFLIDTGSTNNVLFRNIYEQAKDQLEEVEGEYTITGIDGIPKEVKAVKGYVPFCSKEYEMIFLVRDDDDAGIALSQAMGFTVIGMIGTLFLAEHGWVLDFANQEVIIPESNEGT